MSQIIVIGGEHHNAYGVIRAFQKKNLEKNIILYIVGTKNGYLESSRYLKWRQLVHVESYDSLLDELIIRRSDYENKPVIICCSDSAIATLDANRSLLEQYYYLPGIQHGNVGTVSDLMNKTNQIKLATSCGFLSPLTVLYNKSDDNITDIRESIIYPCILKPVNSSISGKADIYICNSYEEVCSDIEKSVSNEFLIQQYIGKMSEFQIIGCSISGGKEVIIPGYTTIIRQPYNTNTGFLKYQPIDTYIDATLLDRIRKFLLQSGYSGLFSIEFIRDKSGVDYFLEINMRNDGNAICVTDSGCNLPYFWYAASLGLDYESEVIGVVKSIYCMPIVDDFIMALKEKKSLSTWISDIKKCSSFLDCSTADIMPFIVKVFLLFKVL